MVRAIFLAIDPDTSFGLRRSSYCGCMLYCSCAPLLRVHPSMAAAPLYGGCTPVLRLHLRMAAAPQHCDCTPVWRLRPCIAAAPLYCDCPPVLRLHPRIAAAPPYCARPPVYSAPSQSRCSAISTSPLKAQSFTFRSLSFRLTFSPDSCSIPPANRIDHQPSAFCSARLSL